MGYYPSNCADLPQHDCNPCESFELGRLRGAAFISADYYATLMAAPNNPALWAAGQASGQIIVIPQTSGEVSEGSPKMGPGFGTTVETLIGYEFSAKYIDPNYVTNATFYNALKGQRNWYFAYNTSTQTNITNVTVTIIPNKAVKDDLESPIFWEVTVKWQDSSFETMIDTPSGVFDDCFTEA